MPRPRPTAGGYSSWTPVDAAGIDIVGGAVGQQVTVEARERDSVGNLSPTGMGTVTLREVLEDPEIREKSASWYAREYATSASVALAWMDVQDRADAVTEEIATELTGDGYAGSWFDNANRRFTVNLKSGTSDVALRQALAQRDLTASTVIKTVTYSQRELSDAQPVLSAALRDLKGRGLIAISRDIKNNALDVEVAASATSEQRAQVASAAASSAVRVTVSNSSASDLSADAVACAYPNCDPPLRGGVLLSSNPDPDISGGRCTSGFVARKGEVRYLLTAGHCIAPAPRLAYAFDSAKVIIQLGEESQSVFSAAGDVGLVRTGFTSSAPFVFVNRSSSPPLKPTSRDPSYPIRRVRFARPGRVYCMTGFRLRTDCGTVLNIGKEEDIVTDDGVQTVRNLGEMRICGVSPGDSGGPIYKSGTAHGIAVGRGRDDRRCSVFFQGARSAQDLLDMEIVTRRR